MAAMLLELDAVLFLESQDQKEVIDAFFYSLDDLILKNPIFEGVREKILEREALSSTCIGSGIAIPHVRIEGLDRFYMVLGIHKEGIDWGAMDGSVVHLVLLILGPDVEPIHYLNYLSSLTKHLKNEKLKEKLIGCDTVHEAYEIFTKEDGSWI